jgi:hypothetical protein
MLLKIYCSTDVQRQAVPVLSSLLNSRYPSKRVVTRQGLDADEANRLWIDVCLPLSIRLMLPFFGRGKDSNLLMRTVGS